MWPFTPMFGRSEEEARQWEEAEVPQGAVTRPLAWLGSVFLGGASGQDPNAERRPLI
jgi:hypothetical protein